MQPAPTAQPARPAQPPERPRGENSLRRPPKQKSALGEQYLTELFDEMRKDRRRGDGVWRGTIGFTPPPSGPPLRNEPEEFFAKPNGRPPAPEPGEDETGERRKLLSRLRKRAGEPVEGEAP